MISASAYIKAFLICIALPRLAFGHEIQRTFFSAEARGGE